MPKASESLHRATLARLDNQEAAILPTDGAWSERPDPHGLTASFWKDPDPDATGVLGADQIRAMHYAVGRMIRPFQTVHLNPASYDLTLGPRYVLNGEEGTFDAKRRILRIPPGSIAMVTSREVLLIPHWLVATFNLKSRYIFDGLLMGVGPQIDPGFMGVLTCPLHNISSKEIEIEFCKPFAKLDFIRTTWGKTVDISNVASEDDLYAKAERGDLRGGDGEPVQLWPRSKNFRPPVSHLAGSEGSRSSLHRLEESFGDLKDEFHAVDKRLRIGQYFGAAFALTVIVAMIALASFIVTYTNGRIDDVQHENEIAQEQNAPGHLSQEGGSRRGMR